MEYWSVGKLGRTKLRQRDVGGDIVEDNAHAHSHSHLLPGAVDHVADHRDLLVGAVEGDVRDDVGNVLLKSRNGNIVHDDKRRYSAGLAELRPVEFPRVAMRAESLGRPAKFPAIAAALGGKLVRLTTRPKRLRVEIGNR